MHIRAEPGMSLSQVGCKAKQLGFEPHHGPLAHAGSSMSQGPRWEMWWFHVVGGFPYMDKINDNVENVDNKP